MGGSHPTHLAMAATHRKGTVPAASEACMSATTDDMERQIDRVLGTTYWVSSCSVDLMQSVRAGYLGTHWSVDICSASHRGKRYVGKNWGAPVCRDGASQVGKSNYLY